MKRVTFREDEILEKDMKPRYGSVKKRSIVEYTYTLKNLLPFTIMEAQMCLMNTYYVSGPSPIVSFVTNKGGKSNSSFVNKYRDKTKCRLGRQGEVKFTDLL